MQFGSIDLLICIQKHANILLVGMEKKTGKETSNH